MVNWDSILVNSKTEHIVAEFVRGRVSGRTASTSLRTASSSCPSYKPAEFSRVVKARGVASTRTLARKALRRRNVSV